MAGGAELPHIWRASLESTDAAPVSVLCMSVIWHCAVGTRNTLYLSLPARTGMGRQAIQDYPTALSDQPDSY